MGPVTMVKAKCSQTLSWTGHRPTCTFFPYDADVIGGGGALLCFEMFYELKTVFFFILTILWALWGKTLWSRKISWVSMDKMQIPTLYHTVHCETLTYMFVDVTNLTWYFELILKNMSNLWWLKRLIRFKNVF